MTRKTRPRGNQDGTVLSRVEALVQHVRTLSYIWREMFIHTMLFYALLCFAFIEAKAYYDMLYGAILCYVSLAG